MTETEFEALMDDTLADFARGLERHQAQHKNPLTEREMNCFRVAALMLVERLQPRLVSPERRERG